jgi:hypothetical protein
MYLQTSVHSNQPAMVHEPAGATYSLQSSFQDEVSNNGMRWDVVEPDNGRCAREFDSGDQSATCKNGVCPVTWKPSRPVAA